MRHARGVAATLGVVIGALCLVSTGSAERGLLVGITDNMFLTAPGPAFADARDLGLNAVHVFLTWTPNETALSPTSVAEFECDDDGGQGIPHHCLCGRQATDAPTDATARDAYCAYVASLLAGYPAINDVVIWNEPNHDLFRRPQYRPGGSDAAPAAYESLLADCWDVLHSVRPGVNVIMSTSPSGNNNPEAKSNASSAPATFIEDMGAAYRASGRTRPIFDTVGHSAYGADSAEPPSESHAGSRYIGEGDLDELVLAVTQAFGGTAQPVPGACTGSERCPSVWYLEDGWQTVPDSAHAHLYTGVETDTHPVTDGPTSAGLTAPTQASQLISGIDLAYCQPYVGAFFNFQLGDQTDLAGWQSGVLWADSSRKASYGAFRQAIQYVATRTITCTQPEAGNRASGRP